MPQRLNPVKSTHNTAISWKELPHATPSSVARGFFFGEFAFLSRCCQYFCDFDTFDLCIMSGTFSHRLCFFTNFIIGIC